ALVERARRLGTLPGFIVRGPDGDLRGWTYYLLHHGSLQIGAVSALADEDTEALIDAVLASPESAVADDVTLFAFASAPGVEAHLGRRGFIVERYRYLRRPIDADRTPATSVTDLVGGEPAGAARLDRTALAALLEGAYPREPGARPFARAGGSEAWLEYVTQLLTTAGCGAFLPECSVIEDEDGRPTAAALVTRIAPDTAHLAQIAVARGAQARGRGRRLLETALARADRSGFTAMTLLVSDGNAAARRLYEGLGFEMVTSFVSAVRDQPRRLSSVALETGGAMTLR
ncbi:MAG: GNAT family N-acetyltransferase, partial [Vicinamibacterales bacterium]